MARIEHDALGEVEVPDERLWGAQTQRSLEHFRLSTEKMPRELVHALVRVKRAGARVNYEMVGMDIEIKSAIEQAASEALEGRWDAEFPLSLWQTGSGTQTNMNVNEVLANRASELLGGRRGDRRVHPNDHVNASQSSNDVFPTAMHVALALAWRDRLLPALDVLRRSIEAKAEAFRDIVKIGRTHLQDAVPITLGQELSGWASQLEDDADRIRRALEGLLPLAIGGTAVGTGLNAPRGFGERVARALAQETGLPFVAVHNRFASLAAHDAVVHAHGALKTLAVSLTKIANDVRWLSSGPRSGLGELSIPENEPGSSIMPGKTNPTQAEALLMACAQVMGNDVTVALAGASGNFELNVMKPLLAHASLQSTRLLADGMASFERWCVRGLEPRPERISRLVGDSLMLVTALVPHVGYDAAARIARHAHENGLSLRQSAVELGLVTPADYDAWVRPERMVAPAPNP